MVIKTFNKIDKIISFKSKLLLLYILYFAACFQQNVFSQWEQTSGPSGGTIKSISVLNSSVLIGTNGGGVFLSTNSGLNWSNITGSLPTYYIYSTLNTPSYLFVGTTSNGVYRTSNNGINWIGLGTNISNRTVYAIITVGGTLYAGTDLGIYRSTNSGIVWLIDTAGIGNKQVYALAVLDTNIFAGTNNYGVYRKLISGGQWTPVNNGLPANVTIYSMSINDTTLYASRFLFVGTAGGGVYKTTNRGANWYSLGSLSNYYVYGLYTFNPSIVFMGEASRGIYKTTNDGTNWTALNSGLLITSIGCLSGYSSSTLYAGMQAGGGIYRTTNSGQNWSFSSDGINASIILSMLKVNQYLFAAAQNDGVFVTTNYGVNWNQRINGLNDIRVRTLAYHLSDNSPNPVILVGTQTGVYWSTSYGVNWTIDTVGMGAKNVNALFTYDSLVIAGTSSGVYKRQTDAGVWTAINSGLTNTNIYSVYGNGSTLYAGPYLGTVYRSTNFGSSWSVFNTGLPANITVNTFLNNNVNLFAGTIVGLYHLSGTTWVLDSAGMGMQNIRSLVYSNNNIFAGTTAGIYYSGNGGANWSTKNDGFNITPQVFSLALDTSNYLYAGTNGLSVWRRNYQEALPVEMLYFTYKFSNNNILLEWATSFEINNSGFEIQRKFLNNQIYDSWQTIGFVKGHGNSSTTIKYTFSDNHLTTGTYQYRLKQIDFNGFSQFHNLQSNVIIGTPTSDFLSQNFPNPTNPYTTIEFGISQPQYISLVLYDVTGKEITTLKKGFVDAGYYKIEFDGTKFSSGVYFYRLKTQDYILIRKLLLLK